MDLGKWSEGEVTGTSAYSKIIVFMAMQKLRDEAELCNFIRMVFN